MSAGTREWWGATISDHVVRGDSLSSEEREKTFSAMVSVALGALAR